MLVRYDGKYTKENVETCMEKHLNDEPVWYMNNYVTLEKKRDKYYVYMSVPTNTLSSSSRLTRKWRLFFGEKGIHVIERFTFFSVILIFVILATGFATIGALIGGDLLWGFMAFILFALFFGVLYLKAKKNVKDFLKEKVQD